MYRTLLVVLCVLLAARAAAAEVVTYPVTPGMPISGDFKVSADGKPVAVYTVKTLHGESASYGSFDFGGQATVAVHSTRPAAKARILPVSFGLTPAIEGDTITFTLDRPRNLTIEVAGIERVLHLFANPMETSRPKPGDPGVIYFGPGVHDLATLTVSSDTTLYLAGGAVLRGIIPPSEKPIQESNWMHNKVYQNFIQLNGAKNVRICGRGVVDLGGLPWHARTAIVLGDARNVNVEGITFLDAPAWVVAMFGSRDVRVDNVKEICRRENSDGVDVCNSQNVLVENSFLRNNDDEVCVKTTAPAPAQPSRNILVRNCVVWNERARGLGITSETRRDVSDVTFTDCDVIHDFSQNGDCAALAILVSDSGAMRNIRFQNIRVDDVQSLIRCWIGQDMWGHDPQRGHVDGVLFKNISVTGPHFPTSALTGCDATHLIQNVTFDNLRIQGRAIRTQEEGRISTNPFVKNVLFRDGK
ncbi:MAG: glycosyl hydrolase family 28 protein [Thermoguttaceae bacterium]|jgi:hypothetical protein